MIGDDGSTAPTTSAMVAGMFGEGGGGGRIVSAMTGALLTSLAVTPLDVAKTRLQLQSQVRADAAAKALTSNTITCPICTRYVCSTGTMEHERNKATCRNFQRAVSGPQMHGTLDALVRIWRKEGLAALWSGLAPTLLISVPATVFYFTSYDTIHASLRQRWGNDGDGDNKWAPSLVAGATARTIAVSIVSPLELLRTRMQANRRERERGLLRGLTKTVRQEGIISLWRGLGPTLVRDVPFSAIYWVGYETLKVKLGSDDDGGGVTSSSQRQQPSPPPTLAVAFVSGAVSGAVAAIVTTPFDVVKTHQQTDMIRAASNATAGNGAAAAALAEAAITPPKAAADGSIAITHSQHHAVAPAARSGPHAGAAQTVRRIVGDSGLRGLMAGGGARVAKVAPACAIMISTYEMGKKYLG